MRPLVTYLLAANTMDEIVQIWDKLSTAPDDFPYTTQFVTHFTTIDARSLGGLSINGVISELSAVTYAKFINKLN